MAEILMSKERYEDLMLRFAKEMNDVGVTENMKKLVDDQLKRAPNAASCGTDEVTRKFYYQHDGYSIEAIRTLKITLKRCK